MGAEGKGFCPGFCGLSSLFPRHGHGEDLLGDGVVLVAEPRQGLDAGDIDLAVDEELVANMDADDAADAKGVAPALDVAG